MTRRSWIVITFLALTLAGASGASAQLTATLVASGFSNPIAYIAHPTNPTRAYVVELGGRVRTLTNGVVGGDFVNLVGQVIPGGGERGLLGMAFAPDYAASGRVYFSFINLDGDSVIARFTRSTADPNLLDPATRFDLVWPDGLGGTRASIDQPDTYTNHKGGNIVFGPDGHLYFGLGDGGFANDPHHFAQEPLSLLGKMLRIDVNVSDTDTRGYRVPFDNPFAGSSTTLNEIWSFGWRNPWRWTFDYPGPQSTGALFVGDVGQGSWEEVDHEPAQAKGRNYGWRLKEGTFDHLLTPPAAFTPLIDPIVQYPRGTGSSVIAGPVYRGTQLGPFYVGRHFFGDFVKGQVWSMALAVNPLTGDAWGHSVIDHTAQFGAAPTLLSSFGTDLAGEMYLVSLSGSVYRIDRQGASQPAGCTTPDPYTSLGGGRCYAGSWFAPAVRGDLSGDGRPDLLLQNGAPFGGDPPDNALYAWMMHGSALWYSATLSLLPASADPNDTTGWRAVATDDFNGDGRSDILVQHVQRGAVRVRVMHGLREIATQVVFGGGTPWRVVATGDLNGDGVSDLVWQHFASGWLYAWIARGGTSFSVASEGFLLNESSSPLNVGDLNLRVVGSGDFSGDGQTDLVLQHEVTGALSLFYLDGLRRTTTAAFWPSPAGTGPWRVRAVADFNGDRRPDLVWQQARPGVSSIYIWYMNGPSLASDGFTTPPASVGVGVVGGR